MKTELASVCLTTEKPNEALRKHLKLKSSQVIRVSFIPGPGDITGTFEHWRANRHDPRVPIVAYSLMFYELMSALEAECQVISLNSISNTIQSSQKQFHFDQIVQVPAKGRWSYFYGQFIFSRVLISKVKKFNPHIVITSTHIPASAWKKLSKNRTLVLTAHNTFWPKGEASRTIKSIIVRSLMKFRATALDSAICTSHECARQVNDLTNSRIKGEVAVPQIVERYPIVKRSQIHSLLFLGRIEVSKGIFFLLDVFELLAERYLDLILVIAGTGSAEEELLSRISISSFSARIKFCGRLDSEGVHAAIAAADLVVCPTMTTFNEGLAVVGFEAAAHGIPTLLSSMVPAAEILGDSCTVYEADNARSIEKELSDLISKPEIYRKKCAATADVRKLIYDRSLSWGSGLFRALLST